jgi:hypothetical protein
MRNTFTILAVAFLIGMLGGCAAIGDIFKAGVWVGVIIVLVILGLVIYLITRGSNKS